MLFNSLPFIFGFFPIVILGFYLLGRWSHSLAKLWLASASLFFYGWWNASFVALLVGSVVFNYCAGYLISREIKSGRQNRGRIIVIAAITTDILLLAYYKYAGFLANTIRELSSLSPTLGHILLPLGISFFTFTQIAFLADAYQNKGREFNFIHYLLFVTYFPHLIAGPILHHSQMMPQFGDPKTYKFNWTNFSVGLTIFIIGLVKKVLLADTFATFATPVFSGVQHGMHPTMLEAWVGALGYTLQLYFDFSGYSDMAIGLSLFFNVKLPLNFNSPYKSVDIIEFWRRWHMTLSRFLRDYLYIPLGGNRKGKVRRHVNIMITMLLGGLWHGAGWTFVAWGGLHGIYLMINHLYRGVASHLGFDVTRPGRAARILGATITFLAVVVGWVFFRADSFSSASTMLHAMAGQFGMSASPRLFQFIPLSGVHVLGLIGVGLAMIWMLPNTQEFMRAFEPACDEIRAPTNWTSRLQWKPALANYVSLGVLLGLSILMMSPRHVSEFLYYQF